MLRRISLCSMLFLAAQCSPVQFLAVQCSPVRAEGPRTYDHEAFSAPFIAASARQRSWPTYYGTQPVYYGYERSDWLRARIWARQYEYAQQRLWEQQRSDLLYWQLMQPQPIIGRR